MRLLALAFAACAPMGTKEPEPDPCALPAGAVDLDPAVGNLLLRRSLACSDHRFGRISDDEYRTKVAAIDTELSHKTLKKRVVTRDTPAQLIAWASSVVEVSSQYSESSWSAQQVLGAPDVFPAYGDLNKAWASQSADGRDEFIEVAFDRREPVSGVEIYETFNPGAIDRIELVTVKGRHIDVPISGPPPAPGASAHRVFEVRCSREPIASVRVHLDSVAVAGWNEIDAIGVVPCTR